jgi:hypothetical protein
VACCEEEVIYEFLDHVATGHLHGFRWYGLPRGKQLDGLFDYEIALSDETAYKTTEYPLGIYFLDMERTLEFTGRWIEFKTASDLLIDDFITKPGGQGKKYFVLVDILVCATVDDATLDSGSASMTVE